MTMFLIQSAILIAIAFVAGCIIGCLARRMFAVETPAVRTDVPASLSALPKNVIAAPEPANSAVTFPAPVMASAMDAGKPKPVPKAKAASKPEVAAELAPLVKKAPVKSRASAKSKPTSKAPEVAIPAGSKPGKTTPAAVKPAADKPIASKSGKPIVAKLAKPVGVKPDNLTLINGIGNVIEKKLHGLGVFRFEQIAKWTKAEAEEASKAVGFPGRAMRENWMKEAAIFMKGGTTDHARKVEAGVVSTSRKSIAAEKGKK